MRYRAENIALAIGCVYEVVALSTRAPTITHIIKTVGHRHPAGRLVLWAWCGFIAWHFLEPPDQYINRSQS